MERVKVVEDTAIALAFKKVMGQGERKASFETTELGGHPHDDNEADLELKASKNPLVKGSLKRVKLDPDVAEVNRAEQQVLAFEYTKRLEELTPWFAAPVELPSKPGVYMTAHDPDVADAMMTNNYRRYFGANAWGAEKISVEHAAATDTSTHVHGVVIWRGLNGG